MSGIKSVFKILPWLLLLVLGFFFYVKFFGQDDRVLQEETVTNTVVLQKMEAMGKMELVKYNFKEITQMNESLAEFAGLKLFESSIVLISRGEAVGCIDMTKVTDQDVVVEGDTAYVTLPQPELCYYKLDMENTQVFSLKTATFSDDRAFIQKAYKLAEREIKKAAHNSGILEQTRENATLTLKPMLETLTGKTVIIGYRTSTGQRPVIHKR